MSDSSADVLDMGMFEDLRDSLSSQPNALASVYESFLGNAAEWIDALHHQLDTERLETLHTLKGSAAMMGASNLAKLAALLQEGLARSPAGIIEATEALEGELRKFRRVVGAQLNSLGYSAEL